MAPTRVLALQVGRLHAPYHTTTPQAPLRRCALVITSPEMGTEHSACVYCLVFYPFNRSPVFETGALLWSEPGPRCGDCVTLQCCDTMWPWRAAGTSILTMVIPMVGCVP